MSNQPLHRPAGRPRRAATDAAIIRAAVDLMTEEGVAGSTLTAVAKRAGVARATVYLRWPTRSDLIGAAARASVGGQPFPMTGNFEEDVRVGASYLARVFEMPSFPAMLSEIVRAVVAHPPELSFDSVAPRRREFGRLYRENAAATGFDPSLDPHLAFDMLLGTAIAYLLANGRPMHEAEASHLADVIVRGMRSSPAGAAPGSARS